MNPIVLSSEYESGTLAKMRGIGTASFLARPMFVSVQEAAAFLRLTALRCDAQAEAEARGEKVAVRIMSTAAQVRTAIIMHADEEARTRDIFGK